MSSTLRMNQVHAAVFRFLAAERDAMLAFETHLPRGTKLLVESRDSWKATMEAFTMPVGQSICVRPIGEPPAPWRIDKYGCVSVPLSLVRIDEEPTP